MRMMFLTLGVLAQLMVSASSAVGVDGVVARVDSDTILQSDVVYELRTRQLGAEDFVKVRDELIERKLILQAAAKSKMTLQEWVVENRIQEIIRQGFKGDRNLLIAQLARQKLTYAEWRERMRQDMIVGAMRWQIVDKNVSPSPEMLRKEYRLHRNRYRKDSHVSVEVILLRPEEATLRDEIDKAIAEQQEFASLAKKYSADAHASEGGLWKDVNPTECFRKEVCDEITRMPVGTISNWVELDGWSFLIRKTAQADAVELSFAEAYDQVEAKVREEESLRLYKEWIERLKSGSFVKVYDVPAN